MSKQLDIRYGVASEVLHLTPLYRASSVTSVEVFPMGTGDDGTAETATTGSGAVETAPDTTVDQTSGAGQADPTLVYVASTTGFELGREYLITGADSEHEHFIVAEIESGVLVRATAPLHNAYVSADTVQSTRIEISVLDSWAADSTNISDDTDPNPSYRIRWIYVATPPGGSSTTYVNDSYFDLVRYAPDDTGHVSTAVMDDYFPGWLDQLPDNHTRDRGVRIIKEAYTQVKWDLHQGKVPDEMIRNTDAISELVKPKAVMQLLMSKRDGENPLIGLYHTEYHLRLQSLFTVTSKVTQSTGTSGAGTRTSDRNLWSR